jgi:hypothetical protein
MSRQKPSKAATQLQAVSKALGRELEVLARKKEINTQIAALEKKREAADREIADIHRILSADPALTAIARQMMKKAASVAMPGGGDFVVANPRHVTAEDKRRLLSKILADYGREHPGADGMSFAAIKQVLQSQYSIETASAGLFFRDELKNWRTKGGNRNKSVILALKPPQQQES